MTDITDIPCRAGKITAYFDAINEQVAKKLEWKFKKNIWSGPPEGEGSGVLFVESALHVPDYARDIGAAWQIVERHDGHFELFNCGCLEKPRFGCELQNGDHKHTIQAKADSMPLAICLAFLRLP
jgi:hypothetical protein